LGLFYVISYFVKIKYVDYMAESFGDTES
jgi:hypothetical protein